MGSQKEFQQNFPKQICQPHPRSQNGLGEKGLQGITWQPNEQFSNFGHCIVLKFGILQSSVEAAGPCCSDLFFPWQQESLAALI